MTVFAIFQPVFIRHAAPTLDAQIAYLWQSHLLAHVICSICLSVIFLALSLGLHEAAVSEAKVGIASLALCPVALFAVGIQTGPLKLVAVLRLLGETKQLCPEDTRQGSSKDHVTHVSKAEKKGARVSEPDSGWSTNE